MPTYSGPIASGRYVLFASGMSASGPSMAPTKTTSGAAPSRGASGARESAPKTAALRAAAASAAARVAKKGWSTPMPAIERYRFLLDR